MTGAERGERSGRGIVQLQSISSPDTDPPEPPAEPPEPFPVPPVASETTSPVTVSLPFL